MLFFLNGVQIQFEPEFGLIIQSGPLYLGNCVDVRVVSRRLQRAKSRLVDVHGTLQRGVSGEHFGYYLPIESVNQAVEGALDCICFMLFGESARTSLVVVTSVTLFRAS